MAQRMGTIEGEREITDDLETLLGALPAHILAPLREMEGPSDLLEVVMDLGRKPEARFPGRETVLSQRDVTHEDIDYVVERIGAFGADNRAGIERTLHRISAIRNRTGRIVGLTCRIGRAIFGTITIIRDLVESGQSILLLGRPGVGKTTMLREVARVLADDFGKRVIIVDTSNEIAGDGDIPHPAIGRARRMQVPTPADQHAVMIEAVENHMPEVIVIDEIGTELEAAAARTIAERGVQLVATAHGNTLENLMLNPTLSDLIGGVQTVTLGDEEARRRGTQKSVLERKAPPTFDILVEIQEWDRVAVQGNVAEVVDSILRGQPIPPEIRVRDHEGRVQVKEEKPSFPGPSIAERGRRRERMPEPSGPTRLTSLVRSQFVRDRTAVGTGRPLRIYPFGVSRNRLESAVREMKLPVTLVKEIGEADLVMTLKNYYRQKPQALRQAEIEGVPIYVLRSNTAAQMQNSLVDVFRLEPQSDPVSYAMQEAEVAIGQIMEGAQPMELSPQNSYIRRLQHQLADRYNLESVSKGREPYRRVKIFRGEGR